MASPSSPRVVVLGDIGRDEFYHLGDEAMTDAAAEALLRRGIDDIVLVATEPSVAERLYGLAAVKRFGFWDSDDDRTLARKFDGVKAAMSATPVAGTLDAAVRGADAVLIAGGGNLNSGHAGQLMERVALATVARAHGKPLFVSGQTVGPYLREDHRSLIREMIDYATAFAARESFTFDMLSDLTDAGSVHHTLDDAALLGEADAPDFGDRYAIGSFANPDLHRVHRENAELIAERLDAVVERLDCDLVLLPHVGSLDDDRSLGDQLFHAAIAELSTTGRIRAERQLTGRQLAHATRRSIFSVSTRYHPAVFAPSTLTPSFPIGVSLYSAVRMKGALANMGQQRTFLPLPIWEAGGAPDRIAELLEPARAHLAEQAERTLDYQHRWWDAIARAITTGVWESPGNLVAPQPFAAEERNPESYDTADDLIWQHWHRDHAENQARLLAKRVDELAADLTVERAHLRNLTTDLRAERARADELRRRLRSVESRRVLRAVDTVADAARRARRRARRSTAAD
ncbi:polysaccharide pyruvyl transferase family protein [Aeromicrobium piscarium]|nr:polysaccharide pyruvyl transferase family protein [Aeromicrobium piscarium]